MKPHNDLSLIYRNFVEQAVTEEEIIEGRRLLSSAGKIKQKESFGYYRFFTKNELIAMMMSIGAKNIRCYRSFGDQANVVIAEKPKE